MTHITLALPYALPLPEFAADLTRALDTPALALLLARGSETLRMAAGDSLNLPHEQWLAQVLDLAGGPVAAPLAPANAAMRGLGLEPGDGHWLVVNPAHIQIARSHLMMADPRQLALDDASSQSLYEAARALCGDCGHELRYGDAQTWFLRGDGWGSVAIASPDAVVGMDLTDFLPKGDGARELRRLQNEVQMAWHDHPVNAARQARGQAPVNAFWAWGMSDGAGTPMATLATCDVPGWMAALGSIKLDSPALVPEMLADGRINVCGALAEAAIAADWSTWLAQMHALEHQLFAPLLKALKDGRIGRVTLLASNRESLRTIRTSRASLAAFWRRPSLERLL